MIDKDPDAVQREMDTERKERMNLDDEQRRQKLIAEQVHTSAEKEEVRRIDSFARRSNEIRSEASHLRNLSIRNSFARTRRRKVGQR